MSASSAQARTTETATEASEFTGWDLRQRVEAQARHIEVIEKHLRHTLAKAGLQSETVELSEPLHRRPISLARQAVSRLPEPQDAAVPSSAPAGREVDWWPRRSANVPALRPTPGWACFGLGENVQKVLAISVFGMDDPKLAQVIDLIADQQRKVRDFVPVFLTSSTAFHLFRRHGFVFEYLPAVTRRTDVNGRQTWEAYASQRLELICRKWGVVRIVCFGAQAIGSW